MSRVQDRASVAPPGATASAPHGSAPARRAAALAHAVLGTLVYADLFDYPLTAAELARYLIGCTATAQEVAALLPAQPALAAAIDTRDGFYFLRGREAVVALRRARAPAAARLWRRAARYVRLLRHFPFVRMIAVTGALAVDNVGDHPDIDLFVISVPGRVWICRRLLILAVRGIRILGDELCPNFILAADSLALPQQDLFTAHELAQMRPLAGHPVYLEILRHNPWLGTFLPNARPWPAGPPAPRRSAVSRIAEAVLRARWLDRWERWELARLARKLGTAPAADAEVACSPRQCKGHTGHYRARVLGRYEARLAAAHDTPAGGA